MIAKTEQLLQKVLQLPEPERWALLSRLLDEMDTAPDADQDEAAWLQELEHRMDDADSGRTTDIPAAEVFADVRSKFRRG